MTDLFCLTLAILCSWPFGTVAPCCFSLLWMPVLEMWVYLEFSYGVPCVCFACHKPLLYAGLSHGHFAQPVAWVLYGVVDPGLYCLCAECLFLCCRFQWICGICISSIFSTTLSKSVDNGVYLPMVVPPVPLCPHQVSAETFIQLFKLTIIVDVEGLTKNLSQCMVFRFCAGMVCIVKPDFILPGLCLLWAEGCLEVDGNYHIKNAQILFNCDATMDDIKLVEKAQKTALEHPAVWLWKRVSKTFEDVVLMVASLFFPVRLLQLLYIWTHESFQPIQVKLITPVWYEWTNP